MSITNVGCFPQCGNIKSQFVIAKFSLLLIRALAMFQKNIASSAWILVQRQHRPQPQFICVRVLSYSVGLTLASPEAVAHQAPLSMGFSRQEYWSGLPFPSPGDLLNLRIEPGSSAYTLSEMDGIMLEQEINLCSYEPLRLQSYLLSQHNPAYPG